MTMFLKSVLRVFGISQTSYGRTSGGNRTFHRVGALLWTRWWVSRLKLWVVGRPGGGQGMAWETAANLIDLMGLLLLSVHTRSARFCQLWMWTERGMYVGDVVSGYKVSILGNIEN